MKRFFVEEAQIEETQIVITGQDVNHIKNVLRMKVGDALWISDGKKKEYNCLIEHIGKAEVQTRIIYVQEPDFELPSRLYLFQALPKGDKMEMVIQKAVELGAYAIIPVATSRCVVHLDSSKAKKKVCRWQQIAQSAAMQSRRLFIPKVYEVCSFAKALELANACPVRLIPYERAKGSKATANLLRGIQPGDDVAIFIGPEGGFSEEEIQQAMACQVRPITLGKRILRTETAGLAILSVLMFQLEEKMEESEQDNGNISG